MHYLYLFYTYKNFLSLEEDLQSIVGVTIREEEEEEREMNVGLMRTFGFFEAEFILHETSVK